MTSYVSHTLNLSCPGVHAIVAGGDTMAPPKDSGKAAGAKLKSKDVSGE